MLLSLRRRGISQSQRRISSRFTIHMLLSLRRRAINPSLHPISSRLTIRMPVSLRRRRISLSPRRYLPRSQSLRSCRKK